MAPRIHNCAAGSFLCLVALVCFWPNAFSMENKKEFRALSHYIMAGIYDRTGDTGRAITEYKQALRTDYQNATIHLDLAASYIKHNNIPQAVKELSLASQFAPEAVEPHAILALVYSAQGKTDEARKEYETALKNASKLEPKNIEIYKSLGEFYISQKRYKEAEDTYKLIVDLSGQDSQAYFYLASIYDEIGDRQQAVNSLQKAIELSPDYHEALNYLGYIYVEQENNLDKAEAMIKKALEFQPDNGAYVDSLGWLYFKQGKFNDAEKELKRADSLLNDPIIKEHLQKVREKINAVQ